MKFRIEEEPGGFRVTQTVSGETWLFESLEDAQEFADFHRTAFDLQNPLPAGYTGWI